MVNRSSHAKQYDLQGNYQKTLKLSMATSEVVVLGTAPNGTMMLLNHIVNTFTPQVDLWDLTTDQSTANYPVPGGFRDSTSTGGKLLSYDHSLLVLASYSTLDIFNSITGAKIGSLPLPYLGGYGLAPDNATIIGQYRAGAMNTVATVSIADGKQKHIFDPPASGGFTTGVAISPDGKQAVAVYPTLMRVWKVQ
jgi:hypothetical protein